MKSNSPDNNVSPLQNIFAWVKNTPERAIDEAFEAAVNIKRIEEDTFKGNKISNDGSFGSNVFSVFEIQLQKHLRTINARLNFYKVSASLPYLQTQSSSNLANTAIAKYAANDQDNDPVGNGQLSANQLAGNSRRFSIYQKLAFIDYTLERYTSASAQTIDVVAKPSVKTNLPKSKGIETEEPEVEAEEKFQLFKNVKPKSYRRSPQQVTSVEKSILPGSFFKAFDRVKRNLSGSYPDYEKDIVEELRQSRLRINQALRYIVVLVISVIAVQFLSKSMIFSPMINSFIDANNTAVKFSPAIEERAFNTLRLAKERVEFDYMIKSIALEQSQEKQETPAPKKTATEKSEEIESLIQQESIKILKRFNAESLDGVKNLLADITAAFVFYLFLLSGRKELETIKEFLDEVLYSLNDNAKAFLIIIATDTFVGFHSSEGWDALLTVLFSHFGLPENKILAQSFISTVPVFLDGLFKFWIFQYLPRFIEK
jgi:CemA family